jgi:hypothetical protein
MLHGEIIFPLFSVGQIQDSAMTDDKLTKLTH